MSENATETQGMSQEEKDKLWANLPAQMQDTINKVNEQIDAHNRNVALIKASQGDESKKLLFELRDQNPKGDDELKKMLEQITKLNERIEALTAQANTRAQSVYAGQLKVPTPEEVEAARNAVSTSGAELRAAVKATSEFSKLMGLELGVFFKDIGSLKGTGAKKASGGGDIWRPRWDAIYANDELIQEEVKNPKTGAMEPKSTFNILVNNLNKRVNGRPFSMADVQAKAIEAGGGDKNNIPDTIEFDLSATVGDETVTFHIKAVK